MIERSKLKGAFNRVVDRAGGFEWEDPLVEQLEKKLAELGIKGVLWDLDDHFLATTKFMRGYLARFVETVAEQTGREYDEIWRMMMKASDAAWQIYHVNPARWRFVVGEMAAELGGDGRRFDDAYDQLMMLYQKSPELISGAQTTLELVKKLGLRVIWVTNANVDWTLAKFDRHNLWNYSDNLVIVDENERKGVSHWQAGVTLAQLPASMLLGGGDSRESDFAPLKQIGVRGIIGVPPQFELAGNGHQPEGIVMVDSIAQWPEGVLRL